MARLPAEPPGGLGVTNSSWPLTTTDSWPRRDPKTGTPATIALSTDPAETPGTFTDRRGPTIDRWSHVVGGSHKRRGRGGLPPPCKAGCHIDIEPGNRKSA